MMRPFWIFTVAALNASDVPTTLYFSNAEYIDSGGNYYQIRLLQPSLINVSPNDGGVLSLFGQSSIGEVELANIDGQLDFLADYAVDGRPATLSLVDGATTTDYFNGTIGRMQGRGNSLFFALKDFTESLATNHPLGDAYAGSNSLPLGLEGTADDIEGKVKPRVYGDCRNIAPVPANTSKLIYQASSKADCVITAVYDEGVRLSNYKVNGAHGIGATSITVDTGSGDIPTGALVMFDGHRTIYTVGTGLAAGIIVLSGGLDIAVIDNACVEVINFYTASGTGATELQGSATAAVWGSYQGYVRLAASPAGAVTCDAMSVTSGVLDQAGDVMAKLADEVAITVDSASVTAFNAAGVVGIYVDADIATEALLGKVAKSVIGYYWFDAAVMYFKLLAAPATTPDLTIEDWMIISITREATGIGSNGVPINGCKMRCDRVETVQTTVAGSVSLWWRERVKNQYRDVESVDTAAQTRYLLSQKIDIESCLRSRGNALTAATRLKDLGKVRRDVVTLLCDRKVVPAFTIGQTALVKKSRYGYDAGRKMVIIGYELDAKKDTINIRAFG